MNFFFIQSKFNEFNMRCFSVADGGVNIQLRLFCLKLNCVFNISIYDIREY